MEEVCLGRFMKIKYSKITMMTIAKYVYLPPTNLKQSKYKSFFFFFLLFKENDNLTLKLPRELDVKEFKNTYFLI